MGRTTIHIFHTGRVFVSPNLPYGGDHCSFIKASGFFSSKKDWIWLPVSSYLIEHEKGLVLVDCGWNRTMSPDGVFDKKAQIKSLDSPILFRTDPGYVKKEKTVSEQLDHLGIKPKDLDYVILTHLDCDHANGIPLIKGAKHILVSPEELAGARKPSPVAKIRYREVWWKGSGLKTFKWNDRQGPAGKSFDLFGDGSVEIILIPGHSDGLCAVRITNEAGQYVLLTSDGAYSDKSWKEMITAGICTDKAWQKKSLRWIRRQSQDPNCIASIANHDPNVKPHSITF